MSKFFAIASCFCLGLFLSNLTYLVPSHFWLFVIAAIPIAIGLCFPGEAEVMRRWSALMMLVGMLANNWHFLAKMSLFQWSVTGVMTILMLGIIIVAVGAIGGQNA